MTATYKTRRRRKNRRRKRIRKNLLSYPEQHPWV